MIHRPRHLKRRPNISPARVRPLCSRIFLKRFGNLIRISLLVGTLSVLIYIGLRRNARHWVLLLTLALMVRLTFLNRPRVIAAGFLPVFQGARYLMELKWRTRHFLLSMIIV